MDRGTNYTAHEARSVAHAASAASTCLTCSSVPWTCLPHAQHCKYPGLRRSVVTVGRRSRSGGRCATPSPRRFDALVLEPLPRRAPERTAFRIGTCLGILPERQRAIREALVVVAVTALEVDVHAVILA